MVRPDGDSEPLSAAVYELRSYAARMVGALPQRCFGDDGDENAIERSEIDWTLAGTPLVVQLIQGRQNLLDAATIQPVDPGQQVGRVKPCAWLRTVDTPGWIHLFVSISPDVGPIQKLAVLFFFFGWLSNHAAWIDMLLTRRVQRDPRRVRIASAELFPKQDLLLPCESHTAENQNPYDGYRKGLVRVRQRLDGDDVMRDTVLTRFVGYISDVVDRGRTCGTVGDVVRFADAREAAFTESLLDRFWRVDYMVWLLPTVGFLGTIYGISLSLVQAKDIFGGTGVGGDAGGGATEQFAQVVDALGTAFDTTAFSLVLVGFLLYQQKRRENDVKTYGSELVRDVRDRLIARLRNPRGAAPSSGSR